ncbi:MAG: FtsX-like permease family protein [Lachnospiraceae bacterium]|nr:FtsX-like permease family protein [Lachnospiraceae bacterium]
MGTKATRKDFYMEIRKSLGRFLSILFIVALGVAFFSGIRASEPSMRITGDRYFDQEELMDIQALSTFGITDDDIDAIEAVEGVERVEGAYSADMLCETKKKQYVFHVMSLPENMNHVTVSEGRLPKKIGECLVDDDMGYKVGDTITLKSGTDDPISDTLKQEKYKVVGIGNSPCYISFGRGSTTIGSGSVSGFLFVPAKTFALDVFTEVYVQVEGAENLIAYTEEYDKKIETVLDRIEEITGERGRIRKQEIVDDAQAEIDDAKAELEEGKIKAQEELDDAKAQIDDGEAKLTEAKQQIADGKSQISSAKTTLNSKDDELTEAKTQYSSGLKKWQEGTEAYEAGLAQFEAAKPEALEEIAKGEAGLEAYRKQLDEAKKEAQGKLKELEGQLAYIMSLEPGPEDEDYEELHQKWEEQYGASIEQLETGISEVNGGLKALETQEQDYQSKLTALNNSKAELVAKEQQLADTKAALDSSKQQLSDAYSQIESGKGQLASGWAQIDEKEQELASGEAEIAESETTLEDAKVEYEEGKKEAEEEITDGEAKIADAEEELAEIEDPKWYVYDRSNLPEHDGYGENADRMRAIGKVFPVIFFLVAALISLTSMTRMVEEQRTQIGTMKALGYSKWAIVSKYLGYALLATAGGSIIGVLIGEKVLPFIIIYAYGIMYQHIPEILVPYDWAYAIEASIAAVACTMFATVFSCYRELGEQPASLMRPPAPKIGKRVLLEYVGFIWKRLNFTWKSTIRNLMRYKKRFFMTIFGIGGCMALMLVGYGIRDSVFEIADIQYTEIQTYDGNLILKENLSEDEHQELTDSLEQNQDITRFMDAYMKNLVLTKDGHERETYVMVLGQPKDSEKYVHFHDRKTKEAYELSDDGAIISEKTAKLLNAKVGDTISVKDENEGNKDIVIQNICENYMGHYLYMTPKYYEKVYGEKPEYNTVLFSVQDSYTRQQMEEAGEKILERDEVLSLSYMKDIEKRLNDMLKSLNLVIIVLIVSAGMLAFVVLYNLNTINIAERKRELATLRVLGFYNPEVAAYVYRENILLTLIGTIVGAGLGKILHLFIIETVEVPAAMFGRIINLPSYIYSFLFTILFSMIVNGVMYFKLRKIDMVESLKSIE